MKRSELADAQPRTSKAIELPINPRERTGNPSVRMDAFQVLIRTSVGNGATKERTEKAMWCTNRPRTYSVRIETTDSDNLEENSSPIRPLDPLIDPSQSNSNHR